MQASYAQRYRALWDGHWWWRSREALLLGTLDRVSGRFRGRGRGRDSAELRILDVGCGDGLFFEALARFGSVDGLEPDATLLSAGSHRDRIRVGRLGPDYRPERPYDLLLMLDVLEHIEEDRDALGSAFESVRPGGLIVLTVPALTWLWSRHDQANEHFRRYDRRSLRVCLEAGGFEVMSVRYFFAWTVLPMLLRRWLSPAGEPGESDYDVAIPPRPLNRLLTAYSRAEHRLGRWIPWPVGSSLLAIGRRPA